MFNRLWGRRNSSVHRLTCMLPGVSAGQWRRAEAGPAPQSPAGPQSTAQGPYGLVAPSLTPESLACLQLLSVKLTKKKRSCNYISSEIIQVMSHYYPPNIFCAEVSTNGRPKRKFEHHHQ